MALVLACGVASAAFAQGFRGFQQGLSPLRLSPTLQTKLKLTADQKTKLEGIAMKTREESRGLFQAGGDRQAAAAKLRELNEKADAEALTSFTPDQKKMYEGFKADYEPISGLGRPALALLAVPGLNADQKAKLAAQGKATAAKQQELIQSAQGDFQGIREKMTALQEETAAGIKKILTPDQAKQFDTELAALPQPRRPGNN